MQDKKKGANNKNINKAKRGKVRAKSHFFRTARYGLTVLEQRIIYYSLLKGQQAGTPFATITFSVEEFLEICEIKSNKYYDTIREIATNLLSKVVEISYNTGEGEVYLAAQWLSAVKYHTGKGMIEIKPNPELKPFFEGKPFSETEYYYLIHFTSQYAERLYEIFKSLDHKKIIDFEIEDLRKRLGVKSSVPEGHKDYYNTYPNYTDFKRFVLLPALEDINKYTDLNVSLQKEKRGRYNRVEVLFFLLEKRKVAPLIDRIERGEL